MTEPKHKPESETKHLRVLEIMNRGVKKFENIQEIAGLERDELVSILDDLEKRGLMIVETKSGLLGVMTLTKITYLLKKSQKISWLTMIEFFA